MYKLETTYNIGASKNMIGGRTWWAGGSRMHIIGRTWCSGVKYGRAGGSRIHSGRTWCCGINDGREVRGCCYRCKGRGPEVIICTNLHFLSVTGASATPSALCCQVSTPSSSEEGRHSSGSEGSSYCFSWNEEQCSRYPKLKVSVYLVW